MWPHGRGAEAVGRTWLRPLVDVLWPSTGPGGLEYNGVGNGPNLR